MDDLTKEFLAESVDGLDRMERCLTDLEQHPGNRELLNEIFRAVHTIKGTTGFLGLPRLELLAHAGENLLGSLRDGRLRATGKVVSGLLRLLDALRQILQLIELTGGEGIQVCDEDSALIAMLDRLNGGEGQAEAQQAETHVGLLNNPSAHPEETQADAYTALSGGLSEQTLRVEVEVLNRMMNLVGDLVLTRNQLLQIHLGAPRFAELTRKLDSVTSNLRETVMQARMQPVGNLFGKFPRMIRDLAQSCGKNVRVEFSGQETGLDKSLLEAIKDPLTHAVRNAVDHGIEDPGERALAGKPAEGVISMRARQHNGSVVIEISDDGKGISIPRVLEKAVERHLITAERAARMGERETLQLLFLPGFSTSERVTHVSGRGVGMDVVLANVKRAGGTVELESREGQGTTIRLRVPLTLAIVPALVVRSGGENFCLPQGALGELVYVPARDAANAVERVGDAELYRLRETLLPIVRLDRMLRLPSVVGPGEAHGFYLVVLETDGCHFGLVVDDLISPEEIVVKPLSAGLREIGVFSGATMLGNGMLAMIVDVAAIAARAGIVRSADDEIFTAQTELSPATPEKLFLVFEDRVPRRSTERGAGDFGQSTEQRTLPLSAVERIESVSARQVEYAGNTALLRYRGELLALEDAGSLLSEADPEASLTVLICLRPSDVDVRKRRFGMVVSRVWDVARGEIVEGAARVCKEPLALVNDRLTVMHEAFAENGALKEVA